MSALEISIRKYAEQPDKSVVNPEPGLSFDSLGEAYDFYNLYSWEVGFGIRYGKRRLNAERTKSMHEIVCGCSVSNERVCSNIVHFRVNVFCRVVDVLSKRGRV